MRAELKSLISVDIDERVYWPENIENFGFTLDAAIGPEGEDSSNYFSFFVCTPLWISTKSINSNFGDFGIFGHAMIIVIDYDWEKIKSLISKLCSETTGDNWEELALKLSRYGKWEYEDYQSSK